MENYNRRYWPHPGWGVERIYYWSHALWERGFRRAALFLKYLNIVIFRAYIDPSAKIGVRLDLPRGAFGVVIGPDVTIGDDAVLLHNVTIGHAKPGPVTIGDRFCAGTGAIILGPVTIGSDVTVGANATVVYDVPDGALVVGPKATVLLAEKRLPDRNESSPRERVLTSQ